MPDKEIEKIANHIVIVQYFVGISISAIIAVMSIFIGYLLRLFRMMKIDIIENIEGKMNNMTKNNDRNDVDIMRMDEDIRIMENNITGLKHDQDSIVKSCKERHKL